MSVTHLAGPGVVIHKRGIQRCLICGEKLRDTIGCMVPVGSQPLSPWPEGAYVRIVSGSPTTEYVLPGARFPENLPDDLCIELVER